MQWGLLQLHVHVQMYSVRSDSVGRGLTLDEAFELLWLMFPPASSELLPKHRTKWLKPLEGSEQERDHDSSIGQFMSCVHCCFYSLNNHQLHLLCTGNAWLKSMALVKSMPNFRNQAEEDFYDRQSMFDLVMQVRDYKKSFRGKSKVRLQPIAWQVKYRCYWIFLTALRIYLACFVFSSLGKMPIG